MPISFCYGLLALFREIGQGGVLAIVQHERTLHHAVQIARRFNHLAHVPGGFDDREIGTLLSILGQHRTQRNRDE